MTIQEDELLSGFSEIGRFTVNLVNIQLETPFKSFVRHNTSSS